MRLHRRRHRHRRSEDCGGRGGKKGTRGKKRKKKTKTKQKSDSQPAATKATKEEESAGPEARGILDLVERRPGILDLVERRPGILHAAIHTIGEGKWPMGLNGWIDRSNTSALWCQRRARIKQPLEPAQPRARDLRAYR